MHKLIFKIILTCIFVLAVQRLEAQSDKREIEKQVEVVKDYKPEAIEVIKIDSYPNIEKGSAKPKSFDYQINAVPYTSAEGSINPIAPAKMSGLPSDKGNYGYVKAGFGNYTTPYGEIFLNTKPSDKSKFLFGLYAKHLSSSGDIDLIDGPKVESNSSHNNANIFGKYIGDKMYARLSLDFDRDRIDYYGWSNSLHETLLPSISASNDDILNINKNIFTSYGASFLLGNSLLQKENLVYEIDMGIHMLDFYSGQSELHSKIRADLNYNMDAFVLGAKLGFENAGMKDVLGDLPTTSSAISPEFKNNKSTLSFSPYFKMNRDKINIYLGINTAFNFGNSDIDTVYASDVSYSDFFIAPDIRISWRADDNFILNARLSGEQTFGYMGGMVKNMPYLAPSQIFYAPNTSRYFAEIGGSVDITSQLEARLNLNYSIYTDKAQYVFGADSTSVAGLRTFSLESDDFNNFQVDFQLNYQFSDALQLSGGIQFVSSSGDIFDKDAYNPNLTLIFSGRYSKNGIYVSPQFRFIDVGTAYAYNYTSTATKYKELDLDNILDLSVEGGYEIMKNLSIFCRLNNLLFQDYEFWYGYTKQSFNGLLGMSYVF
ncbi:MAG: hypothetical protein ACK5IQ_11285 [Bacteroidales bacterium]